MNGNRAGKCERSGGAYKQARRTTGPSADVPGGARVTLKRAAKSGSTPAPSAATIMAAKQGTFRHAEVPAFGGGHGGGGASHGGGPTRR